MRRTLTFLALLTCLALIGGAGPLPTIGAATGKATFAKPVQVSHNDDEAGAEPSIRVARDGTLYIVAPQGLGSGSVRGEDSGGGDVIWRSTNGGKTWKWLGSYDDAAGGGDADIAVDRAGNLWGSGLTLANTTATFSGDRGENWCVNPVGSLDTGVDRQWIETYKSEPVAFMTTGRISTNDVILSRLEAVPDPEHEGGMCPAVVRTVSVSGVSGNYQWPGEIAVDEKNDLVYTAYQTADDINDQIFVTRNTLDLDPLENVKFEVTTTIGDTFDSFVGLDVDKAGNVYVVWNERRPQGDEGKLGVTGSYIAVSKDKGETWSKPIKINTINTTVFPWIVAGSKGRVAITYYGTKSKGFSPESVLYPDQAVPQWRVYMAYSTNVLADSPKFTEVRASGVMHEGNICTSGTGCASGTRDLLDYLQIDLDPCGHAAITYTDNSRDEIDESGNRTQNLPEYIYFVGQNGGPRFYGKVPARC